MKQELIPVQGYQIEACNALAEQVQSHLALAWHKAVQLGYKLQLLKASCGHGEWGKLFGKSNSHHGVNFSFGQNMALRYIQLYEACEARARQLETEGNFLELMEYTCSTPGAAQVIDVEAKETELSAMLSSMSNGATSMRQAMFAFMNEEDDPPPSDDSGVAGKPKGKPLPHMRNEPPTPCGFGVPSECLPRCSSKSESGTNDEQNKCELRSRNFQIQNPTSNIQNVNYRDLYAAEWPGVLAVLETYITDRAPRLYQHDREQYAAQLRELAAAMAAAKGNIVREEPATK